MLLSLSGFRDWESAQMRDPQKNCHPERSKGSAVHRKLQHRPFARDDKISRSNYLRRLPLRLDERRFDQMLADEPYLQFISPQHIAHHYVIRSSIA